MNYSDILEEDFWQFVAKLTYEEGWDELEIRALNPESWEILPLDVWNIMIDLKTSSIYRTSLLGLLLWHHLQKTGALVVPSITARILLGYYKLQPGVLKNALRETLLSQEHLNLYRNIVRELESVPAESSDYYYDSLLISHLSIKDLEKLDYPE